MNRVFLLSPARCEGARAGFVLRSRPRLALASRLRSRKGAPLGEVFSFLSGLYFRGKLAYAKAFASCPAGIHGALVITSNRGLIPPGAAIRLSTLRSFARVPIEPEEPRYRRPLARAARELAGRTGDDFEFILLGSIATDKYAGILRRELGDRLKFPAEFVGRGDMSRGGLLLRCVEDRRELRYLTFESARHGSMPPRLAPRVPRAGSLGQRTSPPDC